ncbi:sensor histidine kinase [Amycolatopsis sp. H20-H5]|uniref:sensor histidine kinase n=1 Tax=Amycolatopsis sp. H20-H5 TaxID=3046309 RepID=UPI002DB7E236|nr:ATP-binding protein [Amycolatopsis sp. H20-H5]MEC3978429.1 ATP-binding protein [Amycolatopsis sp. H20-H5]
MRARGTGIPAGLVQRALPRLLLIPVVFRLVILGQALWWDDHRVLPVIWLFALLQVVPNLAEACWVFRWSGRHPSGARLIPLADLGYGVALNLGAALVVAPAQFAYVSAVTWIHLMGTVMILAFLRGVLAGAVAVVGVALLRYVMAAAAGAVPPDTGDFVVLVAFVATSVAILVLLGASMRFALGFGEQQGRAAERERQRRDVHDTVLQVMESLALAAPGDTIDPVASLHQVRRTARAQAMRLRMSLDNELSGVPAGLHQRLRLLVAEMAVDGLHAEVVAPGSGGDELPDAAVDALHDATREALRNALKHAGTARVIVSVRETGDGTTVIVRDHGKGFLVGAHRSGFGIEHSIVARLDEIGGRADLQSSPGHGTRVSMWAPLVLRLPVG